MSRLLLTGASGTLGRQVARQAQAAGWEVIGTYRHAPTDLPIQWAQLEIADRQAVAQLCAELQPTLVIHTAAVMREPDLWAVTADGAAHVALAAAEHGARLIHLSSDALFDGKHGPYTEAARPSPITPYGAAKAAAETAVQAIQPSAVIVRTSLIISRQPPDQHTLMIRAIAAGQRSERLFSDEYRCPVAVEDLAAAILEVAGQSFSGVINLAGAEAVSRHELGQLILTADGADPTGLPSSTIAASGLHRPADVRLAIGHAQAMLQTTLRGVHSFLQLAGDGAVGIAEDRV